MITEYSIEQAKRLIKNGALDAPPEVLATLNLPGTANRDANTKIGAKSRAAIPPVEKASSFPHLHETALKLEIMIRMRTKTSNICGLRADGTPMTYKDGTVHNAAQAYGADALAELLAPIKAEEESLRRQLQYWYLAEVPVAIREFIGSLQGIGRTVKAPESVARFLGLLGHPVHAFPEYLDKKGVPQPNPEFHRSAAQLRQYCAVGRPVTRPAKGEDLKLSQADMLARGKDKLRVALHRIVTGANANVSVAEYAELFAEERAIAIGKGWDKEKAPGTNRAVQHGLRMVKKQFLNELHEASRGTCE